MMPMHHTILNDRRHVSSIIVSGWGTRLDE